MDQLTTVAAETQAVSPTAATEETQAAPVEQAPQTAVVNAPVPSEDVAAAVEAEADDTPISLAKARELRREHQQLRRDLEAAHTAREVAEKRAQDTTAQAARVSELEAALGEAVIRGEVAKTAPALGFVNADDALLFIENKVEVAEDGSTNIMALLTALAEDRPYLVSTPRTVATGAVTNPARSIEPQSVGDLEGMSPSAVVSALAKLTGRR
jgi:hypothetical protein